MGTQSFPAHRHSGHRWWALCPAQTGELPFAGAREAWFCGHARQGCVPAASPWPRTALVPVTAVTGWGQSCPAGIVRSSGRPAVGGVPTLEGPPATAAQIRTRWRQEGHFQLRVPCLEACTPGRPDSCTPCTGPLVPMGPAGFFHRVIKCQSPRGRQRQLPRLQIRGAREAGCAQGRETARPRTCSPGPAPQAWVCMRDSLSHIFLERVGRRKELGTDQNPACPSLG